MTWFSWILATQVAQYLVLRPVAHMGGGFDACKEIRGMVVHKDAKK